MNDTSVTPSARHSDATFFMDYAHPEVQAFIDAHTVEGQTDREKAVALYYAVRDGFRYDPYHINLAESWMQASHLLQRNHGYCVEKANLLAAVGRGVGIPTRLGFAKVKNHIGTSRLEEILGTDELVFHGYTEFWLDDKWIKATPAFNKTLCEKLGVAPLEWDGKSDSIFQQHASDGSKFMEYTHDYGQFDDVPHAYLVSELVANYGHLFREEQNSLIFKLD